ncbi:hypothetical protein [Vibrio parahaemolyticus]|uniref:hypothetical protein n=1 Tax=Vibrio parahaemolyticus TaxID=670 RepID=UPI001D16ED99|nr:hypothetical protein [Vibrio parahaemolyticus]MCC3836326.1 hypothetical protein [Vibrio parahaemolyticus]
MSYAQKAIDEMLPMITEFLTLLGLATDGKVDFSTTLNPFSEWVSAQEISQEDFGYIVSRLGAFYCQYYVQKHDAKIKEINVKVAIELTLGKEENQTINPYDFAIMIANKEITLVQAIDANVI